MDSDVQSQNFSLKNLFSFGKKLHRVLGADQLNINEFKVIKIKGRHILLCRSQEGFYAINETCAHRGASLANGVMVDNTFQCLKHGCRYDIKTGKHKYGPGKKDLETYKVVVKENDVFVEC